MPYYFLVLLGTVSISHHNRSFTYLDHEWWHTTDLKTLFFWKAYVEGKRDSAGFDRDAWTNTGGRYPRTRWISKRISTPDNYSLKMSRGERQRPRAEYEPNRLLQFSNSGVIQVCRGSFIGRAPWQSIKRLWICIYFVVYFHCKGFNEKYNFIKTILSHWSAHIFFIKDWFAEHNVVIMFDNNVAIFNDYEITDTIS